MWFRLTGFEPRSSQEALLYQESKQLAAKLKQEARMLYEETVMGRCASLGMVDGLSALSWPQLEQATGSPTRGS